MIRSNSNRLSYFILFYSFAQSFIDLSNDLSWKMTVLLEESIWSTNEFHKNSKYHRLNAIDMFKECTDFYEFLQLLSTFYTKFFQNNQDFYSNDQKKDWIRLNHENQRSFRNFKKTRHRNFRFSSFWRNTQNNSKMRQVELMFWKCFIAIRRWEIFSFRNFFQ